MQLNVAPISEGRTKCLMISCGTDLGVILGYVRAVVSSNVNDIVPVSGLKLFPPVGWISPSKAKS